MVHDFVVPLILVLTLRVIFASYLTLNSFTLCDVNKLGLTDLKVVSTSSCHTTNFSVKFKPVMTIYEGKVTITALNTATHRYAMNESMDLCSFVTCPLVKRIPFIKLYPLVIRNHSKHDYFVRITVFSNQSSIPLSCATLNISTFTPHEDLCTHHAANSSTASEVVSVSLRTLSLSTRAKPGPDDDSDLPMKPAPVDNDGQEPPESTVNAAFPGPKGPPKEKPAPVDNDGPVPPESTVNATFPEPNGPPKEKPAPVDNGGPVPPEIAIQSSTPSTTPTNFSPQEWAPSNVNLPTSKPSTNKALPEHTIKPTPALTSEVPSPVGDPSSPSLGSGPPTMNHDPSMLPTGSPSSSQPSISPTTAKAPSSVVATILPSFVPSLNKTFSEHTIKPTPALTSEVPSHGGDTSSPNVGLGSRGTSAPKTGSTDPSGSPTGSPSSSQPSLSPTVRKAPSSVVAWAPHTSQLTNVSQTSSP